MKKYVPYCMASSIYDIDLDFFNKIGVNYLLFDLDNTLDGPHTALPSKKCIKLMETIKKSGFTPIIISNNKKKRVNKYSSEINVDYLHRAFKPFPYRLKKYLKDKNIPLESVIMIGDQTCTDIKCANNIGIKSCLTTRLESKDQIVTILNRKIDERNRKIILKKNLSKDWRELYAKI